MRRAVLLLGVLVLFSLATPVAGASSDASTGAASCGVIDPPVCPACDHGEFENRAGLNVTESTARVVVTESGTGQWHVRNRLEPGETVETSRVGRAVQGVVAEYSALSSVRNVSVERDGDTLHIRFSQPGFAHRVGPSIVVDHFATVERDVPWPLCPNGPLVFRGIDRLPIVAGGNYAPARSMPGVTRSGRSFFVSPPDRVYHSIAVSQASKASFRGRLFFVHGWIEPVAGPLVADLTKFAEAVDAESSGNGGLALFGPFLFAGIPGVLAATLGPLLATFFSPVSGRGWLTDRLRRIADTVRARLTARRGARAALLVLGLVAVLQGGAPVLFVALVTLALISAGLAGCAIANGDTRRTLATLLVVVLGWTATGVPLVVEVRTVLAVFSPDDVLLLPVVTIVLTTLAFDVGRAVSEREPAESAEH